jgi:hypothetical protein
MLVEMKNVAKESYIANLATSWAMWNSIPIKAKIFFSFSNRQYRLNLAQPPI